MSKFPDSYPKDLLERIIEDGAGDNIFENVYRIDNHGKCDRDTFLSSYLEKQKENGINNRDSYKQQNDEYDIGEYSTSLNSNKREIKNTLKCFEKHGKKPRILIGNIDPKYGKSMKTRESKSQRYSKRNHIDWWLYEDADPSKDFRYLEE